jgi:invasion protein IalB
MKRAFVLLSLIPTYVVFGANAAEASDPRALQLTFEPWTKMCLDHSNCFVGAGARGACVPSGGGVAINVRDGKRASLSVNFGTRRRLDGAMSVQIDQDAPITLPNPTCDKFGCRAKLEIDGGFIERLKRAQTITITAADAANQTISLAFPLADFARTYDGPGSEPKVFEETLSIEKMKELMQRAEEEKRERECKE